MDRPRRAFIEIIDGASPFFSVCHRGVIDPESFGYALQKPLTPRFQTIATPMIQRPDALQSPSLAASGEEARLAIRRGAWTGATLGLAPKCVQAHVVILPASLAGDFRDFCVRNAQACPLLAVSEPGQAMLPTLGDDIDIRSDVPAYQVWRYVELTAESSDIVSIWRRDLVTFVIASDFSFEHALFGSETTPIYNTQIPTATVGPFGGPLVVAMRPLRADRAIRAIEASTRLEEAHGLPVHLGSPTLIGIDDLTAPVRGEAREPAPHELPVFWASGLTAQAAALRALPPICITNARGAMLVTDLVHRQLASEDAAPLRQRSRSPANSPAQPQYETR